MWGKKQEHKKRGSFLPFVIFRLLLSLTMFAILAVGVYQAFRYFSGVDPIKLDPKTTIISLLASEDAGKYISKFFGFSFPKDKNPLQFISKNLGDKTSAITTPTNKPTGKVILKFAVVSDSHNENENLSKALAKARDAGAKFVIGLGDYTEVGSIKELQDAKNVFVASKLPYYVTAGDHDLWESRENKLASTNNFSQVFGAPYQSFSDSDIRFVIVSNGDNYDGVDTVQWAWLEGILNYPKGTSYSVAAQVQDDNKQKPKATLVFLHEPIYHPSSDQVMGNKGNKELTTQAGELATMFKDAGVSGVWAGNVHSFTEYSDPSTGLKMATVGALTSQRNTQKPRFLMVDIFEDGGYNIQDTEI